MKRTGLLGSGYGDGYSGGGDYSGSGDYSGGGGDLGVLPIGGYRNFTKKFERKEPLWAGFLISPLWRFNLSFESLSPSSFVPLTLLEHK